MSPSDLRDAVTQIMRDAAQTEILPRFRNLADHEISEKSRPGDLVTAADTAAELFLEKALTTLMPGSVAVGEEATEENPAVMDALSGDAPVWVLDPVDGTRNFARGDECFAVIVALVLHGETTAGWLYDPIADQIQWAGIGAGAWQQTQSQPWQPLSISPAPKDLKTLKASVPARVRDGAMAGWPGGLTRYFCVGREYMAYAQNTLGFGAYGGTLKPWDHAAGVLIHAEAGGYGALIDPSEPYSPVHIVKNRRLLLAPDEKAWQALREILLSGGAPQPVA